MLLVSTPKKYNGMNWRIHTVISLRTMERECIDNAPTGNTTTCMENIHLWAKTKVERAVENDLLQLYLKVFRILISICLVLIFTYSS